MKLVMFEIVGFDIWVNCGVILFLLICFYWRLFMLSDFIVDMLMCICNVMCMYKEIVDILVFKFKEEFVKLFVCEGYV